MSFGLLEITKSEDPRSRSFPIKICDDQKLWFMNVDDQNWLFQQNVLFAMDGDTLKSGW